MGFMDELKRLAHPYEDDDELDDEYEDGTEAAEEEEEYTAPRSSRTEKTAPKGGSAAGGSFYESRSRDAKVVNITNPNQMRVVLVEPNKPATDESMQEIADHLMAKHTVVLNMEKTDEITSDHLLYFMGGVVYAVQGNIKRIAKNTYIVTPHNVDMEGELRDELENQGWMY